jgi:hypothetical protein
VEINWPLLLKFSSAVFLCDELCSFGVWNADGVCARAWMYRQPQEDWENFLSVVNGFLNQAEADMRNRGVQAMLYLVLIVSTKRNSHNGKSFFIIWSRVVSQKITRVGINMVTKALMNSKQAAQMKVKCVTMLTMMKTFMTVDFLREMNHYSQQMC